VIDALALLAQVDVGTVARDTVLTANLVVAAAIAFAAGLLSFASPCVIPLVPGYLSFVTGLSGDELGRATAQHRARVPVGALLFVLGFAVPFVLFGAAAGLVGALQGTIARVFMGTLVSVLGLLMIRGRLWREHRLMDRAPDHALVGAPVLGFVFGVGWTPCLGPTAGAIFTLTASASDGDALRGALLGFVYALGLGVPFILFALAFHRMAGVLGFLRRNARRMQIAGGWLLVAVGVSLATGLWELFMRQLRPLIGGFVAPL
jgi:cytochrome c-type biogenesis protein